MLQSWSSLQARRGSDVSILVLLEAVLQYRRRSKRASIIFLFQSLFYWKLFCNIHSKYHHMATHTGFQSFFYWKLFCNEDECNPHAKRRFQSLFYWKLFCNRLIFPFIWQINALYASVYRGIGENQPSALIFIRFHQYKLFAKVPEPLAKKDSLLFSCSEYVSTSNTPPPAHDYPPSGA